jgi:Na+-driven multidrug efflux pump
VLLLDACAAVAMCWRRVTLRLHIYCRGFIKLSVFKEGPKWPVLKPFLRDGAAVSFRTFCTLGLVMGSSSVLARVGTAAQAAHEIVRQVWVFLYQVRRIEVSSR